MSAAVNLKNIEDRTFIDPATVDQAFAWHLGPHDPDWLVLTIRTEAGAFPAATLTVEVSHDGVQYDSVPAGAVTHTSAGMKSALTVTGMNFVRVRVTTAAGSAGAVRLMIYARCGRDFR